MSMNSQMLEEDLSNAWTDTKMIVPAVCSTAGNIHYLGHCWLGVKKGRYHPREIDDAFTYLKTSASLLSTLVKASIYYYYLAVIDGLFFIAGMLIWLFTQKPDIRMFGLAHIESARDIRNNCAHWLHVLLFKRINYEDTVPCPSCHRKTPKQLMVQNIGCPECAQKIALDNISKLQIEKRTK